MEHIPQLVTDLALLLAVAGIVTIVCKQLKQPLVLGYVIAGFLVSPAIGFIPNIIDSENISTWAEIGVIFLMFGLGLEFSIVKLTTVGKPAIITALVEMILMIGAGMLCGTLLGWSFFTSLFLGGMLAISSTTIIVKAFGELGLKGKKFTELVFGALVIEDIVGIFLMVILSTIAVGGAMVDGGEIVAKLGQMVLYLIIWFVLSIIIVPTVLKKVANALNDEIILIVSIALCLGMVVLANAIGFSAALGAFLAGSILAGTVQAHRIEELFKPIKDLFGAVFFVSVGMLVAPDMIVENIIPIIIITLVTLIGKPIFSSLGALLSGQSLKTSVKTGLSLSQIGEFSFIIASLGVSLGVTADFLYPVIVSVSVITTLTTPFYIKNSDRVYGLLLKVLPNSLLDRLACKEEGSDDKDSNTWIDYLKRWAVKIVLVVIAAIASAELFSKILKPLMGDLIPDPALSLGLAAVAILITGLFTSNLFYGSDKSSASILWVENRKNHLPLIALFIIGFAISGGMVIYIVFILAGELNLWLIVFALLATIVLSRSKQLHSRFLRLETNFVGNLNESILAERRAELSDEEHENWVERHLYITKVEASRTINRRGVTRSADYLVGLAYNLDLIAIERDGSQIASAAFARLTRAELNSRIIDENDPLGIREGDILTFIGTEDEIDAYLQSMLKDEAIDEHDANSVSLETYLADDPASINSQCFSFTIEPRSRFRGKTIEDTDLRGSFGCMVVALEHNALLRMKPNRHSRFASGDRVWVLGDDTMAAPLLALANEQSNDDEIEDEPSDLTSPKTLDQHTVPSSTV